MPAYGGSLIELMDGRIDASQPRLTKMGTVTGRSAGTFSGGRGSDVDVILDGSSGVAQPVKCFENVLCGPGDRVGLVKIESDWVVVGCYTQRGLADVSSHTEFGSLSTTTSATYIDMPGSPATTYTKVRDSTVMRYTVNLSAFCTVGATPQLIMVGLRVTSQDGSIDYDQDVRKHRYFANDTHMAICGFVNAASAHPAMSYTVTARWYRFSGSGLVEVDTSDTLDFACREIAPEVP